MSESIRCVAVQTGFYRDVRVRPGQEFDYFGEKVPKWARRQGEPAPKPKPALSADLRPEGARKASKTKAAGESDLA
jgi:hypothetical protein